MEFVVDSNGLSDFGTSSLNPEKSSYLYLERTNLYDVWKTIKERAHGRPLMVPPTPFPPLTFFKIGVIGVWTDTKVAYLCYDLVTRLEGQFNTLATCSSLTGSVSRPKV